jgi:hypothetical protein
MRRTIVAVATVAMTVGLATAPAMAHTLKVTNPKTGEQVQTHRAERWDFFHEALGGGWVGGGGLPGQGQGLIYGGPLEVLSAAHGAGLNTACEANDDSPSAVDIRGPGPSCPHGE